MGQAECSVFGFQFSDFWHNCAVKVKRRMIAILLGCALVGVCVALLWPRGPKEPEYQGKKLSELIATAGDSKGYELNHVLARLMAMQAIRSLGGKAIPYLVRWTG